MYLCIFSTATSVCYINVYTYVIPVYTHVYLCMLVYTRVYLHASLYVQCMLCYNVYSTQVNRCNVCNWSEIISSWDGKLGGA